MSNLYPTIIENFVIEDRYERTYGFRQVDVLGSGDGD